MSDDWIHLLQKLNYSAATSDIDKENTCSGTIVQAQKPKLSRGLLHTYLLPTYYLPTYLPTYYLLPTYLPTSYLPIATHFNSINGT